MVVPGVKSAVLLIPPALRAQFAADFKRWALHFRVPNLAGGSGLKFAERPVLRVLAYSELSHASATTWFQSYRPDLVILDECQSLQDRKSVRTHRFLSYIGGAPETRVCAYSGSLTSRSIQQYAHLSACALRAKSPLPIDPVVTFGWAGALDPVPPGGLVAPPGALTRLCRAGETPRSAYLRRLRETPGAVTTEDSRLDVKLRLGVRAVEAIPQSVRDALSFVRTRQARPDGEEFAEATEVAACAKQVATGMYLRWKFPRGEPEKLIEEWRQARKEFARELREKLMHRRPHLDSPALCVAAAQRHFAGYKGEKPTWAAATWERWNAVRDSVHPESEAVWIDDFLVRDALEWALERSGIVWCGHPAFGHLLAKLSKGRVPYLGGGDVNSEAIAKELGQRSIAASIASHGTGKNLQSFCRNLIVDVPSDAGIVEQLVGRTYRYGQRSDVTVERYAHTPELSGAWDSVLRGAVYVRETTGSLHGVLFAEQLRGAGEGDKKTTLRGLLAAKQGQ